jgi:2-haloacid dehalogenase
MPAVAAAIFDAYGTLLDLDSAMAPHAARLGSQWPALSAEWRVKQTEYTWVRTLAGPAQHRDFARLTDEALAFVAARHGITDTALLADLSAAYRRLGAWPDAKPMLEALRRAGIGRAILSNGTPAMLAEAASAAGIDSLLDDILSVEAVGVFKPDPRVYRLATARFAVPASRLLFVSSNPWDAFGALQFGFQVAWINRHALPDQYGLRGHVTELADLASLPAHLPQ